MKMKTRTTTLLVSLGCAVEARWSLHTFLIPRADSPDGRGGKRAKKTDVPGGFTFVDTEASRRKIRIEYIPDKSRRHITFSKRKAGIMKKVSSAFQFSAQAVLTP